MSSIPSPTLRPAVALPPMPDEDEASRLYPACEMARARFERDALRFDEAKGFDRALSDGFFLLKIPTGVELDAGDRFVRHFFEPPARGKLAPYTGYRNRIVPGDYQGYFKREHDQWENFYIERSNWGMLPAAVARTGKAMSGIGIDVLRATLGHLGIPEVEWNKLTGGLTAKRGHQMLAFNHFRSDKPVRGSKFHRDSGWITMLRSLEPGLEVRRGRQWLPVVPRPDAFVMNFGCAIEILTKDTRTPVAAVAHRVVEQQARPEGVPDRFSYALFADSSLDTAQCEGLYRFDPHAGLVLAADFNDFLDKILANTYERDTEGLY